VKPPPFEYFAPRALSEALDLLAERGDDAKVLAGGQSLMPMLNLRLARPAALVDINRVTGLDDLRVDGGVLRLGALVRQRALERWARDPAPLLAAALRLVGHTAIRVRGTVAGSIAHADPASELPALLLCLDGTVVARSRRGERTIAAGQFFQGLLSTALASDEIVTETRWTLPGPGAGWGFHEIARRHGDFALAGVAAVVGVSRGRVDHARVALFGVGPTALRGGTAEARLIGQAPAPAAIADAAAAATSELHPDSDLHASGDYRRRVARTLMTRALTDAVGRATAVA
jgi:carbon-monoxide dehydrogenase medium subunit